MLNNSTTAAQTLKVSELLLNANWQRVESETIGAVFTFENFAKGWDTIIVHPAQLQTQNVAPQMRKLTTATFLLSSVETKMAYVLASEENPVYISNEYDRDAKFGYLMAFRITPLVTPEYLYYMCKYDAWKKFLSRVAKNEEESCGVAPHWNQVGKTRDFDPISGRCFELNAETFVRNLGEISVPSLEIQRQRVTAAKDQAMTEVPQEGQSSMIADIVVPLLNKYKSANKSILEDGSRKIGLLRELYKLAANEGANQDVLRIVSEAQYPFTENVLSEEEMSTLAKHIDAAFDLLISPAEFSWEQTGCFMQPKEVTDFMTSLINFKKGSVIYNPFAGLASYSIALNGYNIIGEEINPTTWAIAQIRLFANGVSSDIRLADSLAQIKSAKTFDSIITSPAILKGEGRQPLDILIQLYEKLNDGGQLVCLLPTNCLQFISDNAGVRKRLIQERSIKAVITLPCNIFTGISISQSVIILTKGVRNDAICFCNASEYTRFSRSLSRMTSFDRSRFARDVKDSMDTYAELGRVTDGCIAAPIPYEMLNGDSLVPAPYLVPVPENGVSLSEIVDVIRPESTKGTDANFVVKPSDIPANLHDRPFVPQANTSSELYRNTLVVDGDAVILSLSKQGYNTVYLQGFHGSIASSPGLVYFFKPKSGVSARYIAALLATKEVADQIKAISSGSVIARISSNALMNIVIPQHRTSEEREQLISEVISSEMSEKERELSDRLNMLKTGLRMTRHAMVQTWSALQTNWEELEFFIQDNGGQMKLSDVIGDVNPISVKDMMATIGHSLKTLSNQIDSLKLESVNWGEVKSIDPFGFINRYIAKHTNPRYKLVNVGNDNHADVPWFNDETGESGVHHVDALEMFKAPERMVERIFDNIVANAVAHGFTDNRKDYRIVFDWKSDDDGVVITIANNGEPFKNGVTGEMVLTQGFTTELNSQNGNARIHSGQGGFEIKELMDGLGKVRVISEPDSELPVIYELTFTDTNFEPVDL